MTGAAPPSRPRPARVLPLGRVLGVPVQLAPSWFLFALLVVVSYGPQLAPYGRPGRGYLAAAAFALLLLLSVLLHEVGHCVVARAGGIGVRRVTVSFLAGLTEMTEAPRTPGRAAAVSSAGPVVSVLLAGAGHLAQQSTQPGTAVHAVLVLFTLTNAGLAVFNLLPGLPLDGGAVLRAVVWRVTGRPGTGTVVAARAGQVLAVLVVPLSVLVVAPLLGARVSLLGVVLAAFVAAFVWAGATAALRPAVVERRLGQVQAGQLARPALLVRPGEPLAPALARAHQAGLRAMVVVDAGNRPVAVVSEAAVAAVPEHRRPWVDVGDLARPLAEGLLLDPALSGEALLAAVRRTPAPEYVLRGGPPRVLVAADLARAAAGRTPLDRPALARS